MSGKTNNLNDITIHPANFIEGKQNMIKNSAIFGVTPKVSFIAMKNLRIKHSMIFKIFSRVVDRINGSLIINHLEMICW